jgi:hypothetical protein
MNHGTFCSGALANFWKTQEKVVDKCLVGGGEMI